MRYLPIIALIMAITALCINIINLVMVFRDIIK